MATTLDDCFLVFVRDEGSREFGLAPRERELVACPTYAEAEDVRRENAGPTKKCIIRYVGPAGGGD
jgi:hypothetical protein